MKKISLLVASLLFASSAYAGNFEGLSVFGKAGVKSSEMDVKYDDTLSGGGSGSQDGLGKSDYFGAVGIDYGFKINEKFVALIGAEIDVNDTTVYKSNEVDSSGDASSVKFKQKNSYGVYVAPGYMINDDALLYAKLSYNRAKFSATFTEGSESGSLSDNFDGFGFGVGARVFVAKNIYLNAEWQKITYGSEKFTDNEGAVKFKPESTVGTVGIGYNF